MPRRYQYRTCAKCHLTKIYLDFDMYPTKRQRKPTCKICTRDKVRGNGPYKAPEPCVGCGKEFEVKGPHSRAALRKACSRKCAHEAMRKLARPCQHCHRILPYESFARKSSSRSRKLSCMECEAVVVARTQKQKLETRPIAHIYMSLAESCSHRSCLTPKQAIETLASGCRLCPEPATMLALIDPRRPWRYVNVAALCEPCVLSIGAMDCVIAEDGLKVIAFIERHLDADLIHATAEPALCHA